MTGPSWAPEGFDAYRELYPGTPRLPWEPHREWTERFVAAWHEHDATRSLSERAAHTTVVFVRGYLGNLMPGNLRAARDAAVRLGFDAFVARNRSRGTVDGNVTMLARQLSQRPLRARLVFCGHSRGGLECLAVLAREPALRERCDGVALSQTPFGPSPVIESILLRQHRDTLRGPGRVAAETAQRAGLALLGARRAGLELTGDVWPTLVARVVRMNWPFPVLQTASWSSRPTAWLDSFHRRLGEIGPGRAHDGQFFLDDLIWPRLPHILLPRLDHAQPAVGGHGFDAGRYWMAALAVLLSDRPPAYAATSRISA